jgi:hypothetical protein
MEMQTTIERMNAARSVFLDADIPAESSSLAEAQLKLQYTKCALSMMKNPPWLRIQKDTLKLTGCSDSDIEDYCATNLCE